MESIEKSLENPEIEISYNWTGFKREEIEDEKRDELEAGIEVVVKALAYLENDLVVVSNKIKGYKEEQQKLQEKVISFKTVKDKSSLTLYHGELSNITSSFNTSQVQYMNLISAWNRAKSVIHQIEKSTKKNDLTKYKDKFEKLRPDLNEMLSRVNQYQMALIQTRKMMLDLSKDDERMILFRDLESLELEKNPEDKPKARTSTEKSVGNQPSDKKASEVSKNKNFSNSTLPLDKKKLAKKIKSKSKKSFEI